MPTPVQRLKAQVEANLVKNGTMDRIDKRRERQNMVAKWLGFDDAQLAFNKIGKSFLTFALPYIDLTDSVMNSVNGFISLLSKGWKVDLAFECSFDAIYDEIDKEEFLNLCENVAKEASKYSDRPQL